MITVTRRSPAFLPAVLTTGAMFPLIWMGGLVTSTGTGMSVPDWPNTFGYNMWAVPLDHWLGRDAGGVFYEHFHRLLGTLVGFLAVVTALSAYGVARTKGRRRWLGIAAASFGVIAVVAYVGTRFGSEQVARGLGHFVGTFGGLSLLLAVATLCRRREERAWLRRLTLALLAAVCVQGLLGGLRVVLVSVELAIAHGIFAQLTLCLGGFVCLAGTYWWASERPLKRANQREGEAPGRSPGLAWGAFGLTGFIVAQLMVAAFMRHYDAGLAVPDVPLHFGQVVPPTDAASLAEANAVRAWDHRMEPVTLGQVWLHVAHRVGAVLVTLAAVGVLWQLWRRRAMPRHGGLVAGLLIVQITLGVLTVLWEKPADLATLHVACGASLLLATALLAARLGRRDGLVFSRVGETRRSEGAKVREEAENGAEAESRPPLRPSRPFAPSPLRVPPAPAP